MRQTSPRPKPTRAVRASFLLSGVGLAALSVVANGQRPAAWHDDFVEHIVGTWKLEGTVMGKPAHHIVKAEWMMNHQFVQIREQTAPDAPDNESRYDSLWYLGYDDVSDRYVLHLIDVFGGRFSETLGFGTRNGNDLLFIFEYPDGPFHNRWRWLPASQSWEWHLEQKDKGQWKPFANFKLTRKDG